MVASQHGILAVGGWDGGNYRGEILKLDCMGPNCQWEPMAKPLKIARCDPTLIPLPRSGSIDYHKMCDCNDARDTCITCKSTYRPMWENGRIGCQACACDEIGTASCTKSQTGDSCNCHPGYDGNKCQKCSADYNFYQFPNCTRSKPSK